jgi:DNA end-binding protein Ku
MPKVIGLAAKDPLKDRPFSDGHSGSAGISLNQLHAQCKSRIRYKKTCPIHGEVPHEDIVSGNEYTKGHYVVVDSEEVEKLRSPDEKAVRVESFVPLDKIDALYLSGKNYYLVPDGPAGQKAYQVIHRGLIEASRAAIGHVVMRGKDQYVVVRPHGRVLVMATLHYADQVAVPSAFEGEVVSATVEPEELQLVKMLIKATSESQLDTASFKDHYTEKLMQVIEAKVAGKKLDMPTAEEPAQVINLMDALRRSLEEQQGKPATKAKAKPSRKTAPSKPAMTPRLKQMA